MTLTASPNPVTPGGTFTLTWSSSDPTATCTATNSAGDTNWNGSKATSGSQQLTASTTPNIYTYTLTCTNTAGPGTATVQLYDGIPLPVATDCGVTDNFGRAIPTLDWIAPNASVSTFGGGLCLGCSVTQPTDVVDQDPTNYATLNSPVGLMANEGLTVTNSTSAASGFLAGFVASNPKELLTLDLLQSVTVSTLLDNTVQETAGATASSPLKLDLVTLLGTGNKVFIGFSTTKPFNGLRINNGTGLSTIDQVNVYQACVSTQPVSSIGSSSSSGGSSSSSSSSSGGSSSSSSGGSSSGGTAPAAGTIVLTPSNVKPGDTFTVSYSVPSGESCTAFNTNNDTAWSGTVSGTSSKLLTSSTTPNIYSYGINCSSLLGGTSTASAQLFDGMTQTMPTDCGVVDSFNAPVPTQSLTDATASVATGTGGLCLLCSVSQPQNVLDQNPDNYAVLNTPVGLIDSEFLTVVNNSTITVPAGGKRVGFVAANPKQLLTLNLLQGVTVNTLLNGTVQETAGTGALSPTKLDLLTLLGNGTQSFVSFNATKPFDSLQISTGTLLSSIDQVDVYKACIAK